MWSGMGLVWATRGRDSLCHPHEASEVQSTLQYTAAHLGCKATPAGGASAWVSLVNPCPARASGWSGGWHSIGSATKSSQVEARSASSAYE